MTDEWMVYKVIGINGGDDIELDFGMQAQHDELKAHRASGSEIHHRAYRVYKHSSNIHWLGPWKLDTPSDDQKELISMVEAEAVHLKEAVEENGFKRGYVFVNLNEKFGALIAGYVYSNLYSSWMHRCAKRKYENEFRSLEVDVCPECEEVRP